MFRPIALLKYGSVALALLAVPYPAAAQSAEDLRAEVEALRKENASLRERYRLSKENAAMHKRLAPRPASAPQPSPLQANAADLPVKAPPPAVVVAGPSWAGFYIGGGFGREQRKTRQGSVTVFATNGANPGPDATDTNSLDQTQYGSSGHILGGWLWQYDRVIFGVEGDYVFGGRSGKDGPRYLVPENCSTGVIQTGNFGCASGATFGGSFQTRGHLRAIAGWEFTPRFMGFLAGGLAIGELGAGGIQVGGIIFESPGTMPAAGSVTSTYDRRILYGYSWGGGIQAKLNESLVGRLEYLRDEYNGPSQTSVVSTNTSGSSTVTATSNPQPMRITNETLRASLIYRFDPNVPFYEAAQRDFAQFGRWQGSGNAFAGFYAGVGLSQNNYDYRMIGNRTLTINDSTTPGVDISERTDTALDGAQNGKNFLLGYRFQAGRLVVGAEREFVRGSFKDLARPGFELGFASGNRDILCYEQFEPNLVCLGLITTRGAVETRGRFRAVGGVEITPSLLAFVGYGRAYGRAQGTSGSSQGIVAVPPSSPLIGAATVTRAQSNDITGHTFGGGVEFKATDNLMFRVDYWRDHYTWNAIVCGGAGFGGTIGTITVNSFAACTTPVKITNEAFQASIIYQFWNPQGTGAFAGGGSPLLALAGAVGSPLAAFAKASPVYKAPPGAAPAGYSWTGFYAGAHGGYGGARGNLGLKGWLAGAQVGYNHQVNQWVFGVEADGSFTDIWGQTVVGGIGQPLVLRDEVEGLATIAGRLGFAWNNALLYGKGGAAWVRNHLQFTYNGAGNAREWQSGWMAGVGLEYGIGQNWSIKVEYNFLDVGTKNYTFVDCNNCPSAAELKQQLSVVKLGLNWRFYNPSPVVARY